MTGSCSYYLNHHYGNIKSPNYPSYYGNNEHCTWLIEAPRGYYIYLNFGSVDLERCYNCGCDVVKIFDGNSTMSPIIKRACGQQTSGCGMYSSGRFLFVQFSSDGSATRRGFSATFNVVSYNYGNARFCLYFICTTTCTYYLRGRSRIFLGVRASNLGLWNQYRNMPQTKMLQCEN